jgi:hypothetical protein
VGRGGPDGIGQALEAVAAHDEVSGTPRLGSSVNTPDYTEDRTVPRQMAGLLIDRPSECSRWDLDVVMIVVVAFNFRAADRDQQFFATSVQQPLAGTLHPSHASEAANHAWSLRAHKRRGTTSHQSIGPALPGGP